MGTGPSFLQGSIGRVGRGLWHLALDSGAAMRIWQKKVRAYERG